MRLGLVLKAAPVIAALGAVGLVAAAKSIDMDAYRRLIADLVSTQTGRNFAIAGEFKLDLSLTPRLVATELRLADAGTGTMLRIPRLEAEIRLVPLLRRQVDIRRLTVSRPELVLERAAEGPSSWDLAPLDDAFPAAGPGTPHTTFSLGRIELRDASVTYRDHAAGITETVTLDHVSIDSEGVNAAIAVTALGRFGSHRFDVSGLVGSLSQLHRQTRPFPLKVKAKAGGTVFLIDGTVGNALRGEGLDVKLTLEGTEVAEAARLVRKDLPPLGPIRAVARLTGSAAQPRLTEIDAGVGKKDLVRLSARGSIAADAVVLALTAEADDAMAAARLAGLSWPKARPLRASAQLSGSRRAWRLTALQATAGDSDLGGEAALVLGRDRPTVTARLRSRRFDLADFGLATSPGAARNPAVHLSAEDGLPVAPLREVDVEVVWNARHFVLRGVPLERLSAQVALKAGLLVVQPVTAILDDGRLDANLTVDAKSETTRLRLAAEGAMVPVGAVASALDLGQTVVGGRGDFRLTLAGAGRSLRDMAGAADGDLSILVEGAAVDAVRDSSLTGQVIRHLDPTAGTAPLDCMVARFRVADGTATAQSLLVDAVGLSMAGSAIVDLRSETVRATLVPRPAEALMAMPAPLEVSGPLAEPVVMPAPDGAFLPGLGLLPRPGLAGSGEDGASESGCRQAMRQLRSAPAAGQPILQPAPLPSTAKDALGNQP